MLGWPESEWVTGPYYDPSYCPEEAPSAYPVEAPTPQAHDFLTPPALPVHRPAPVAVPTRAAGLEPVPVPALPSMNGPVPVPALPSMTGPVPGPVPVTQPGPVPMPVPVPAYEPVPPYNMPMPWMQSQPETARERRNKAEKARRDRLSKYIAELAKIVPQVVAANRKVDRNSVLRLTAHCLRIDHVYGHRPEASRFSSEAIQWALRVVDGSLLTVTYKGLVVTVSYQIKELLGYTELDLYGYNIINLTHEADQQLFREQLRPTGVTFGARGELVLGDGEDERRLVADSLANQHRNFCVRLKRRGPRWEPTKYVQCHVEGSFKISDHPYKELHKDHKMIRRPRARSENPCASGNDVVFVGCVRPMAETFRSESALEAFKMEYRTRHSVDGEILSCDQRISLVTGYMTAEVRGINAMSFIHHQEVRWVILALKEMYNNSDLYGESCYRLLMRNGKFVYMYTRGQLEVDVITGEVTSFSCTNTVVDNSEGRRLVNAMKQKLRAHYDLADIKTVGDSAHNTGTRTVAVEDPKTLKNAILNLVTNLPSSRTSPENEAASHASSPRRLSIIAPTKERIVSALEKINTAMGPISPQQSSNEHANGSNITEIPQTSTRNATQCDSSESTSTNRSVIQHTSSARLIHCRPAEYKNTSQSTIDLKRNNLAPKISNRKGNNVIQTNPENQQDVCVAYSDKELPGITVAVKRPKNIDEVVSTKKKIIDANNPCGELDPNIDGILALLGSDVVEEEAEAAALEAADGISSGPESHFSKQELNTQIEDAMEMLENSNWMEPNLLEFLVSDD